MAELVSLLLLQKGEVADIHQLAGTPERIRRFEELGLRAGVRIEMVQGGSPCIIRVAGTTLCLRDGDLSSVLVRSRKTA